MEKKLNIIIVLLVVIAGILLVDMYSSKLNAQSSSAMRNIYDDDVQGGIGGTNGRGY